MNAPTEAQIVAAARALADHNADVCNVNREDNWMIYGDDFRESAKVALDAALSLPAPEAATAHPADAAPVAGEREDWLDDVRRAIRVYAHACCYEKANVHIASAELEKLLARAMADFDANWVKKIDSSANATGEQS